MTSQTTISSLAPMVTYGEEVYCLAESFIRDARIVDGDMQAQSSHELAMEIQRTVDDFFYAREI